MFGVCIKCYITTAAGSLTLHSQLELHAIMFCLCFARFCASPSSQLHYVDNVLTFERPGIGIILVYMAVEGVLFFILTILIEVHGIVG